MIVATSPIALGASVVAVITSVLFLTTMLRYRNDPTTRPLIGIAVTLLLGALLHLGIVDLAPVRAALGVQGQPTESLGGFWVLVAFDLTAVVSGLWFLFALQYTGRGRQTSPFTVATVAILFLLVLAPNIVFSVFGSSVGIPISIVNSLLGIAIVLGEGVALIGIFLVLSATFRHRAFPAGQTALLTSAIGIILVLPFAAITLQLPVATPLSVVTAGLLFTTAVRRYRIFETLPVASVVGRERVIDEMSEGVVMTDADGSVRALNPAAESLLGMDQTVVVGEPLDDVLPSLPQIAVMTGSEPTDVHTDSGRIVAVTADDVTDDRGRRVGHLLVCRDVTDRRQRGHRLGVLTQLLAGATQEELDAVADIADDIVAGDRSPQSGADRIHSTATDIATLVARVRDLESAVADRYQAASVSADVTEIVSNLQTDADVTVTATDTPLFVTGEPELLRATLEALVTAAATEQDKPKVQIEDDSESVSIDIVPFTSGAETSIADFSLQIARLAAENTDWCIRLVDEGQRSGLTLSLPRAEFESQAMQSGRKQV
jgi:PAS domain S-box-containing protein